MSESPNKPSWLDRLGSIIMREPEDRDELVKLLHSSFERDLMDADALAMIEGALQVSELQARDIMIPRSQVDVIDIEDPLEKIIGKAIETAHSRFPAIGDNKDDVIGILLAKDLLRYIADKNNFEIRDMLRPAVFIPESKRLNVLLKDFRSNRNHIAIVVDEYGGMAGIVTIEDVLEQIVGDIEDEYDFDETEANIVDGRNGQYRVKAQTEIADINDVFGTNFSDQDVDTIGGLVLAHIGRLPKNREAFRIKNLQIRVLRSDSRRLHYLLIKKIENKDAESPS